MRKRHRLILNNDGGTLVGPVLEAPLGVEGLTELTIGRLKNTQIDTIYWTLGTDPFLGWHYCRLSDYYSHNTKVAPQWGEGVQMFDSAGCWRIYENTRQLIEEETDPPAVVIEQGHRIGLDVFLSMRVNDAHDGMIRNEFHALSPTKIRHPEWLLGSTGKYAENYSLKGHTRFAYNFALPEVREYKLAISREAIEKYDLDGLDWDFCRIPRLFPGGKAKKFAPLLTVLLYDLKKLIDNKSKISGRKIYFSVRVPPTFELAMGFGMDVRTWLEEGLIDILIAGVYYGSLHRVPIEEYVKAAHGSDVEVIAQNLGLIWYGRPHSARVLWHEQEYFTSEMCRASALNHWHAGVDGLYLFNNHLIEFAKDAHYDRQPWKEIADPNLIARKDKHYLVDNPVDWEGTLLELGAPPIPKGPLPVGLKEAGDVAEISVDIGDDLNAAVRDGALKEAILRLLIVQLTGLDKVKITLNDRELDLELARTYLSYNDYWLDFDVSRPLLKRGWNKLKVEVLERNPYIRVPLTLESVEVIVRYK